MFRSRLVSDDVYGEEEGEIVPRQLNPVLVLSECLKKSGVGPIEYSPCDGQQDQEVLFSFASAGSNVEGMQVGWTDEPHNLHHARQALRDGGLARDGEGQVISYRQRRFSPRITEEVQMVCYVQKRSRYWREWRERWACLTNLHLLYFKWPGNYQRRPTERIPLADIRYVMVASSRMKVVTAEREFCLQFDSPAYVTRWAMRMGSLIPMMQFVPCSEASIFDG